MEFFQGRRISARRSCELVGISRSVYQYRAKPRGERKSLCARLRDFARRFPVLGYRMAWADLRRQGLWVNHKAVHQMWKEEGLSQPRRRRPRRRGKGSVPLAARHVNHVWTYDFVQDATVNGRMIRVLTVEDECTREGLALEMDRHLPASRVREIMEALIEKRGAPDYLRSDNGPEFIASALIEWLHDRGIKTHHIDPGSPWQNAYGESFNATVRREFLNGELFHGIEEGRIKSGIWLRYYNERRSHSSLGYLTPSEFRRGVRIPLLEHGRPSSSASPHKEEDSRDQKGEAEEEGRKGKHPRIDGKLGSGHGDPTLAKDDAIL